MRTSNTGRSPLKDAPLRSAGQSLRERKWALLEKRLWLPFLLFISTLSIALQAWLQVLTNKPPGPLISTLLAVLALVYLVYRVFKLKPEMDRIKLGYAGERLVGEFLESLREQGYKVFHDLLGDGFNVDHVIIGPTGIYTIETKTYSKPASGKADIVFDGSSIKVGHWEPKSETVIQAHAQAGWLQALLRESSGKTFQILPVILFPGWYIKTAGRSKRPIWVLNPKSLPAFLNQRQPVLTSAEIKLASYHLSRFVRAGEKAGR